MPEDRLLLARSNVSLLAASRRAAGAAPTPLDRRPGRCATAWAELTSHEAQPEYVSLTGHRNSVPTS